MPLQATSGAASYDAFGGGVPVTTNYIEDVFSTYLYTGGTNPTTISNGINLSDNGGLVWTKARTTSANNGLVDTVRGSSVALFSNTTEASNSGHGGLSGFTSTGYSINNADAVFNSSYNYVSWTFRKQPKFFDIQTWTGNSTNRTISHALGSVPGCIMVKRTDTTSQWQVYHRSIANTDYLELNTTAASALGANRWNSTTATSTVFSIGTAANVNATGGTYVAYIFAHNAGGFGLTGTDNVISCGSLTHASGTADSISLGYEPQWLLIKRTDSALDGSWYIFDTMRGFTTYGVDDNFLLANLSNAEDVLNAVAPTATGFQFQSGMTAGTYIYIAIRRGPMKVPTSGMSVFTPAIGTTDYTGPQFDATFPRVDLIWEFFNTGGGNSSVDRLRGESNRLRLDSTTAETISEIPLDMMYGAGDGGSIYDRAWMFGRAPSFADLVCYTGTGVGSTQAHNLGVAPEMMFVRNRGAAGNPFGVYAGPLGPTKYFFLNSTAAATNAGSTVWNLTAPTSSVFSVGSSAAFNRLDNTYVAYLFATLDGVSKVGSYTGTGTTQQVNCGFTSGARFVLIKRTDNTGDWYVWDSARGIVAGNDPYMLLNSTAAEVTSTDYIDTYSAGFEISSTAPIAINASGGTFIFLAIA